LAKTVLLLTTFWFAALMTEIAPCE